MKSRFLFTFILLTTCFLTGGSFAEAQEISDDLVTFNVEAVSKAQNTTEASKEIMQAAMTNVAREQVIEILGDKKYQKNRATIDRKIIAEAAKFIPISNSKNLVKDAENNFKAQVELKVSLSSLKKMIQATGLLVDSDELAVVLPLVVFRDDKNTFAWWEISHDESKRNLNDISQLFDSAFSDDMFRNAFYVLKPSAVLSQMLPEIYRTPHLKKDDYKFFSGFYHANLIARGEIVFKTLTNNTMELNLKILISQSSNDREIAEVSRTISIERANLPIVLKTKLQTVFAEVAKDLSAQVLDTWQKGTLGSNSILIAVKGLATPKQVQDFKTEIRKNIHDIKALKERIFESGQVTFEMDYNSNDASIVEHLKTAKLDSFDYRFVDSNDKLIKTEVRAKTR